VDQASGRYSRLTAPNENGNSAQQFFDQMKMVTLSGFRSFTDFFKRSSVDNAMEDICSNMQLLNYQLHVITIVPPLQHTMGDVVSVIYFLRYLQSLNSQLS
jgi:hypothetical protein